MRVLAVDPGNVQSAFVILEGENIIEKGILPNDELLDIINHGTDSSDHLAIEMIASYGMAVGVTVFETCVWIGRFIQAFGANHTKVYRKDVKMNLCGSMKAKDGNIRQALIDRYGEESIQTEQLCPRRKNKSHSELCPTCGGMGIIRPAGVLAGVSKDVWSALAVGLTYQDSLSASN